LTQQQLAGGPTAEPPIRCVLRGLGQQEELVLLMLQQAVGRAKHQLVTAAARQQLKLARQAAANEAKAMPNSSSRLAILSENL
jgi:hypothetical protein